MSLQLASVGFQALIVGDGASTQITIDLTSSAAWLTAASGGTLLTKNFNVGSAVGLLGVSISGGFTVTGSISSGKVTLNISPAPASGQVVGVSGELLFNGA